MLTRLAISRTVIPLLRFRKRRKFENGSTFDLLAFNHFVAVIKGIYFPPPHWKRSAIALPAPLVPPVTKTRLPVNSFASNELPDDEVFISYFMMTVNVELLKILRQAKALMR
jgi:hypothetical protein